MKSRTKHYISSAFTHAAEATKAQETHCCCTRHVPPRSCNGPCPFTADVIIHHINIKATPSTIYVRPFNLSMVTHATRTCTTCGCHVPMAASTTENCNGHAATDPLIHYFQNATYAYTIYLPQTYAWSVSTRLVLMRLPVPSPSTTEDQNASALQLFSEWRLSFRSPTVLPFRFPLHVVVLPPAEHTGFSSMILPNHCLCNAIPAN